jgi:beta-lactamase regulating signal transducer with metallopeptidase domain
MTITTIAAWLLTYLIHSTIILGAVMVVSRILDGRSLAIQETLLRTALLGGVLTASVQLGLGFAPMAGIFSLEAATLPQTSTVFSTLPAIDAEATVTSIPGTKSGNGPGWATPFVVLWGVAAIVALTAVLRSVLDLKRLLRSRCFQPAGHLVERLAAAMGLRQQVRVSTSKAIAVPFATGISQPEICCPERVNELAREHQTGLFAHEIAHLARRDPAWQLLYRLGEALFVIQPLNRLVRRRLEEIAEHLTDERAAACTGDRLGLARCLVVVAHWGSAAPIGLPATTFAAGPRLDRRVRRLLSGAGNHQVSGRWAIPIGAALLVGAVAILPMVGTSPAHAELSAAAETKLAAPQPDGETNTTEKTRTWSTSDDRPTDDPPPAAEPPTPPTPPTPASPVSEVAPVPGALPAPASPPSAPTTGTLAPPAPPATAASPMPSTEPAPPAAPTHSVPVAPSQPSETERHSEEQEARERARQSAEQRMQLREEQRSRAEAMVREQRVIALEQARSARRMAEETARQFRVSETDRREIRIQVRERQAVAQREARELSLAERDRARALSEEARAAVREAIINGERLTDEQREKLLRQASDLRNQTELRNREATEAAKARARALADEARRLAEQAETERLQQEKQDR